MTITELPGGRAPTAQASATTTLRTSAADVDTLPAEERRHSAEGGIGWYLVRSALSMVAICSLGLIFNLVVLSQLLHASAQHDLTDRMRSELANGLAPVQAVDPVSHQLLADGSPVGILRIPDLDVNEVVVFGSTPGVLMDGVGLRRDSTFPGQRGSSVIMGRAAAYGGPFGDLNQLAIGSTFTVTTGQGVQHFSVTAIRHAGDPLPPPAASGSRLTLISAGGSSFVPSGLIRVDADLLGNAQPTAPRAVAAEALRPAERALAGDPSNVWYLVFALQALLAAVLAGVLAWYRWGHLQAWVVCAPLVLLAGLWVGDNVTDLLPNLM